MKESFGRELMIVAQLSKLILWCTLLTVTTLAMEPAVLLAQIEYENSKQAYEEQTSICSKGDNVAIPIKDFHHLKFTEQEWNTILFYSSRVSFEECSHQQKGNFVIAANTYLMTAKHFKEDASGAFTYSAETMFSYSWQELERKIKYMAINESKRDFLEKSVPSLHKPFDIIKTFENIRNSKLILPAKK